MVDRYNTHNPVPSNAVKDYSDNAQIIDEIVHLQKKTTLDRFGNPIKTFFGMNKEVNDSIINYGYVTIDSFEDGAELDYPNEILRYKATGEYYRWDGDFPKNVPENSTPENSGGVGVGHWLSVGDATLRTDIQNALTNDIYSNHQRKVYKSLPLIFKNYNDAISAYPLANYLYPQSFCVFDSDIYIAYTFEPRQVNNVLVKYDANGVYVGYYFFKNSTSTEGCVVNANYGGLRVFIGDSGGVIRSFSFDGVSSGGELVLDESYNVGVYHQFGYHSGKWIVEQNAPENGQTVTRTVLTIYDQNFKQIGTITVPLHDSGYIVSSTDNYGVYLNKRQGMAIGPGYIVFSFGGYFQDSSIELTANKQQGTKVFNSDGSKRTESMLNPQEMINILRMNGFTVTRIENEGISVPDSENKIYSMFIHIERSMPEALSEGIVIFEEYSNSKEAIDFDKAADLSPGYNIDHFSTGVFPRSSGGIFNPVTGEQFEKLTDILYYMQSSGQKIFSFYTSSVTIEDLGGNLLPSSTLVTIASANNVTFMINYQASAGGIDYIVGTDDEGKFVFIRQRKTLWAASLTIQQSSDGSDQLNRITAASKTGGTDNSDKILVIDQQASSNGNPLIIGGSSSIFKSATVIDFATNPNKDELQGTGRWRIADYGMRPLQDNTYSFGQSAYRIKDAYFANAPIISSDGTLKTKPSMIEDLSTALSGNSDAILDAWGNIQIITYQWLDAVAAKGQQARWHFGVIAQQVRDAFIAQGIDPHRLGFFCFDEWDDEYEPIISTREIIAADGTLVLEEFDTGDKKLIRAAGSQCGIRPDQCMWLEAAYQRRRLDIIEKLLKTSTKIG